MTLKNKMLGRKGESQACQHLVNKGYRLVGQNIKLFCGEIDLLMQDKDALVIVEVKTKSNNRFGLAGEMITNKKRQKLLQLARTLARQYPNKSIRIDVVTIDKEKIKHLVSAVEER